MTELNHLKQASRLFDQYMSGVYKGSGAEIASLSEWMTEDLVRLYHLIDVELQERAFNANFQSPFDEVQDDFGPPDEY